MVYNHAIYAAIVFHLLLHFTTAKPRKPYCGMKKRSISNSKLVGFVYKSFKTDVFRDCFWTCKDDEKCMSLNYNKLAKICQFSSKTRETVPQSLVSNVNWTYISDDFIKKPANLPKSCLDILVSGAAVGDGEYWIDPGNTGNPIKVYCDMTTDSGGWTLIKRLTLHGRTSPPQITNINNYRDILPKMYSQMVENILLSGAILKSILDDMGFTQMWFYCRKQSVNRTLSIITAKNASGAAVVRYFTDDASAARYEFPDACGSFVRLHEDDSVLAQNCEGWGQVSKVFIKNKWGAVGLHGLYRFSALPMTYKDQYCMGTTYTDGYLCDDGIRSAAKPLSVGDKWEYYVR